MKVAMTTFGADGGKSGIGRYVRSLIQGLAAFEGELEMDVFVHDDEEEIFLGEASPFGVRRFGRAMAAPVPNIVWHQTVLPAALVGGGYDLLFLPCANRRLPFWSPVPTVGTVHDFSCLHMENKYDRFRETYIRQVLPALMRRLDGVITVSRSSLRDIVDYARVPEEKVDVIPLGVDHELYRPRPAAEIEAMRARLGIEGPYVVYVSRIEHPGKNHVALIEAFDALRKELDTPLSLVFAGSDWNGAEAVHELARSKESAPWIRFTGFAAEADLPLLYAGARAMVFPSLYEGFGLPILEAMACGTPVACSRVSSMPEVAGDAALLFGPHDQRGLLEALRRLVRDDVLCADLARRGIERARSFTWEMAARRTLNCFERLALESRSRLATVDDGGSR